MITEKIAGAEKNLSELAAKLGGTERNVAETVVKILRQCARVTAELERRPLPITEPVENTLLQ